MATDAERLLAEVRELVRREVHPVRNRLGELGIGNVFREGRLRTEEWIEAWILIDRLLGANTMLIELFGVDEYVGETWEKVRQRKLTPARARRAIPATQREKVAP